MKFEGILFGDTGLDFSIVIVLRTFIMFLIILLFLRLLGKRGIRQLSVFELVVILGLGSAAGDPMIYEEIGLISALIAFSVIVICYKLLTILVFKYQWIEQLIEGKEVYIIKNGTFAIENFKKETLSKDEFFMELRLKSVFHLGQVEYAILETSGEISVFFFDNDHIKYGLPILPNSLQKVIIHFKENEHYSCTFCGTTIKYHENQEKICKRCGKKEFVKSSSRKKNA